MTGRRIPFAIVFTSIPVVACLCIGNIDFLQKVVGQAEETFGQNATFLEEVERMQLETQTGTQASQNQTNATSTQIPKEQLQQKLEGSPPIMASSNELPESKPRIVISGENAYIIWGTNGTGDWEVMFRASNDNGETFGDKINLSNSSETNSGNAEIAASGSKVYIIWQEKGPDNATAEYVLRTSNDDGQTFGPIIELSGNGTIRERQTFSTYENASYGIQMQYPSDWQVRIGEEDNDSVIDIVGFYSPTEYRLDNYDERIWISLDNIRSENITLEEYFNEVINYKNESLQDFHLLDNDTDSMILAGYPAYRLVYTSTLEDGTINKQMEIGTKIGDKVYYLTYYAEEEKYHNFLPVIHDMINSFEIQDK
jgi:hypothetical protein